MGVIRETPVFQPTKIAAIDTAAVMGIYYSGGPHTYAAITASQTAATALVLKADDTDGATTTDLTVDVSAAATNTYGEVVDAINALSTTTYGWHAFLVGARRSEFAYNDEGTPLVSWVAQAAVDARRTVIYLLHDTSRELFTDIDLVPVGLTGANIGVNDEGKQILISKISAKVTYTASGNVIQVYSCDDRAKTDTLEFEAAAGADGAEQIYDMNDWGEAPLAIPKGRRAIVRVKNAGAITAPTIRVDWAQVGIEPASRVGLDISQV